MVEVSMTVACLAANGMISYRGAAAVTRLLVGTAKGIDVLERKPGGDWHRGERKLNDKHVSSLAIEPVGAGIFAGIHKGGVFHSADGGATWEERSNGITIEHVYSVTATVEDGKPVVYCGTEPPCAFRSADLGKTWEELPGWREMKGKDKWVFPMPPKLPHSKAVVVDPHDPKTIYVGVEQGGLFVSDDRGQNWRELDSYDSPDLPSYRDLHTIAVRPNHPNELFFTSGMGLFHSTDRGETWMRLTRPEEFRVGYPDKLAFAPEEGDQTMFICGASKHPGNWRLSFNAEATVMKSEDLGRSWTEVSNGLPHPLKANLEGMCLYAWPGGYELFVGTTNGVVYHSDDRGANWREIGTDLGPVSKAQHWQLLIPGAYKRDPGAGTSHGRH
jgi:photosystem II stability/assembly factor-like uncharacterized protein